MLPENSFPRHMPLSVRTVPGSIAAFKILYALTLFLVYMIFAEPKAIDLPLSASNNARASPDRSRFTLESIGKSTDPKTTPVIMMPSQVTCTVVSIPVGRVE